MATALHGKDGPQIDVPARAAKNGTKLFKGKCVRCHTIEKSGNVKQGPPLVGVMGRTSGSVERFAYSAAAGILDSHTAQTKWPIFNWKFC